MSMQALLPVLHHLFRVHETSNFGRNSKGFKPNPHALRCNVTVEGEEEEQQVCGASASAYKLYILTSGLLGKQ